MAKKILIGLGVFIVFVIGAVVMQPDTFRISRSASVSAAPAAVFAQVNDFHNWGNWSPWEKMDPAMKKTYEGPAAGEGASYSWAGNDQVGEGKMTIIKSEAPSLIHIDLNFMKPFQARNLTEFVFTPDSGGTKVTWTMSGKNGFIAKAMHLMMDMDKMVGPDFEKGLAQLKATVEKK